MAEETNTDQALDERRVIRLHTGIGSMPFGRDEALTEEESVRKQEALDLFRSAYSAQMDNRLDEAVELYTKSIEAYPTAEAHTFRGWAYNFMGLTDDAIAECKMAIGVDPDFGNPYNDIGAYLIEQGDLYGAVHWLERAITAKRYECYFYPHFNLGRVYEGTGRVFQALREYRRAVQLNPGYKLALRALIKLAAKLN
ncbi:MAG TPA: tetratricopeptide repeat protein [Blastocatellia bacterium]